MGKLIFGPMGSRAQKRIHGSQLVEGNKVQTKTGQQPELRGGRILPKT
jgi:hypothetical protein